MKADRGGLRGVSNCLFHSIEYRAMRLLLALLMVLSCLLPVCEAAPVKPNLHTDMGNDVDDLTAPWRRSATAERGAAQPPAVTVTKDHPQAAAFVDAVNTFYGYPIRRLVWFVTELRREPGKFNLLADEKNADWIIAISA